MPRITPNLILFMDFIFLLIDISFFDRKQGEKGCEIAIKKRERPGITQFLQKEPQEKKNPFICFHQ